MAPQSSMNDKLPAPSSRNSNSQVDEGSQKASEGANFSWKTAGSATLHYQVYDFSFERLAPLIEKLETPGLFRAERKQRLQALQNAWDDMFDTARETFANNLKCTKCGTHPFAPSDQHKMPKFDYEMNRILELSRDQNPEKLTEQKLDATARDFLHFEDKYFESDLYSSCQGLRGLRANIKQIREDLKNSVQEGDVPSVATKNKKQPWQLTVVERPRNPVPEPKAPVAKVVPRRYMAYNLSKSLLEPVMALDLEDASNEEVIRDAWIGMYREAQRNWNQNMTCPACQEIPGSDNTKHRYSQQSKNSMGAILDDFMDIKWYQVTGLTQRKLDEFKRRLIDMEDNYLDENLESGCKGLLGLHKGLEQFRKNTLERQQEGEE